MVGDKRFEQDQLEAARPSDFAATSGIVFSNDAKGTNAFSKLSRYETSMERSLYRTLHELQRLQAVRHGKEVPVPLAVDIDISGAAPRAIDGTVLERGSDAAD